MRLAYQSHISSFSILIKSRRKELGLSQEELAKEVNVGPVYISQLERGLRKTPSDSLCRRLAKVLDLDIVLIFKLVYRNRLPMELRSVISLD